ncbi:TFIIF-interacting CTD phosphatase, including NLI-interacting factor [Handroanthus impetiginosus]|uniref:TFIIF-interacting CTD phosphatase, including NLI-interacting factor n=1 Tax=Handroanthus impetiginosus TaxID=429701 RepID=A0A2G9H8M4_9LAMI|nr:TFIIF-interacting CTD phosphatase, including NLI-interacting factor [Handroanthus impetiginosus]
MPSIKMKTKSNSGCLKEKNGLHICRKSSMISKNPLSRAKVPQNAEEICIYAQSNQDGSPVYDKVYAQDIGGDITVHDNSSNEEKLLQKQPSSRSDTATDSMEPSLSTSSSNMETIFSPIVESMDFYSNEGSDNLYVPQLDSEDSDDSSGSSCEYQACSGPDFHISDIIFSELPPGSNSNFDNKTDAMFLPDYKCGDSSLLCDLTEEYLVLPFLEDAFDTGYDNDGRPSEENFIDVDNSSLYMGSHQIRSYSQDSHIDTYPDQDYECFDPQMYIRNVPYQPDMASTLVPASVPHEKQNTKQITLVLDLDETLVHSTLEHCDDADFTFPVFFNMKEHTVYVKQRPHLQTFLKRVAEMFEVVVFTASQSFYAKQLLDILDPEGKVISRRAYRESCIFSEGSYTKDLTILGVDLAKVAIIDNSPQVFRFQVNNGIPIKSWFDDPSDSALISLLRFLETLVDAEDVRPLIARKFGNKE